MIPGISDFHTAIVESLKDPISGKWMDKAVTLVPCRHTLNEDTTIQCLARTKLCPLDHQPITAYVPNHTVRQLIRGVNYQASQQKTEQELMPQAESLLLQGEELAEQSNLQTAIEQPLKALKLCPNHGEAQASLAHSLAHESVASASMKREALVFSDGSIYEGECKEGRVHGQGKATLLDGTVFEGKFKNGLLNGQGKVAFLGGLVYEGKFKDSKLNGQGKWVWPAIGTVVEGEFKDNELHGQGRVIVSIGIVLEGEFKSGKLHGQGKMTFPSGTVYEGEFKNDRLHRGKMVFPNGEIWEGEFKNDKLHGYGKKTFPNGEVHEGEF